MSGSSTLALAVSAAVVWGLSVLIQIVFLVVVLTTVRPRRPDVAPIFLLALGLELLFFLAGAASSMVLPRLTLPGGVEQYQQALAISNFTVSLGHAVSRGLLIWGIARLARDKVEAA